MEWEARALPSLPRAFLAGQSVGKSDSQDRKVKIATDFYILNSDIFLEKKNVTFWGMTLWFPVLKREAYIF